MNFLGRSLNAFVLVLLFANVSLPAGEPVPGFEPTAQDKIFKSGSKWIALWQEGEFTEGPAVAPDGSVYFSDIGNRLMKYDPVQKKTVVVREPSGRTNGLFFHRGELFACEGANVGGRRRISVTATDGKVKTLVDNFQGKKLNSPNDLFVTQRGNVFFTDPRYVGDEPVELGFQGVFLVDRKGMIRIATKDLTRPNGILINQDETRAWVAEHHPTQAKQLVQFNIDQQGKFYGKKVLFDFQQERGIDGMCFGPDGKIYATAGDKEHSGIYVFSPAGKPLAFQPTPGPPTNCTFGIKDKSKRLYVTTATEKMSKENADPRYGLFYIDIR